MRIFSWAISMGVGFSLFASVTMASDLTATNAFARATPPGSTVSSVYFQLTNDSDEERRLVSATTDVTEVVEIHTHIHDDEAGVHQMRRLDDVAIPGQGVLQFEPGGLHLMLINLDDSLEVGEEIAVTLTFDDDTNVHMIADVRRPGRDQEAEHQHLHPQDEDLGEEDDPITEEPEDPQGNNGHHHH